MRHKLTSIILSTLTWILLTSFVSGGRNHFVNGTNEDLSVRYRSTVKMVDKPVMLHPGGGLVMTDDNGTLLQLTISYAGDKTLRFSQDAIRHIQLDSHVEKGVWWITTSGVEYVSDKESLRRRKSVFGHW